jgi:hypothetical protein
MADPGWTVATKDAIKDEKARPAPVLPLPPTFGDLTKPREFKREEVSIAQIGGLARDLTLNCYDLERLLEIHDVPKSVYERIKDLPFFKKVLETATEEWGKPENIKQRIALQAAVGVENLQPVLIARLSDEKEDLDSVVKGATLLANMAGLIGKDQQKTGEGEKVTINIDLGGPKLSYETKDVTPRIDQH